MVSFKLYSFKNIYWFHIGTHGNRNVSLSFDGFVSVLETIGPIWVGHPSIQPNLSSLLFSP